MKVTKVKCQEQARQAAWWPLLSKQLEEIVQNFPECCKSRSQRAEPLKPTTLPSRPWQKIGTDLFKWKKSVYLLIVDYYSRWIEIVKLGQTTAECVITHSKSIFEFRRSHSLTMDPNIPLKHIRHYEFQHVTSSPYHPQGNGRAGSPDSEEPLTQSRRPLHGYVSIAQHPRK